MTVALPPEFWLGHQGLDAYSKPLTTVLTSLLSLEDIARDKSPTDEPADDGRWIVARAVAATSLDLAEDAREKLIEDVSTVYAGFARRVEEGARQAKGEFRAVRRDVDPDQEPERESDDPSRWKVPVVVTGMISVSFTEALLEEHLRSPLIAAVTPYVAETMDPTMAAAEIGLNLAVSKPAQRLKAEAVYIAAVASFEIFVNDIIGAILDSNPKLLRESKETFTANQVLDAKGTRALRDQIRIKMHEDKTRNFRSRNDFLVRMLGDEARLTTMEDIVLIRNDLVHHGGRATKQNSCSYEGSKYRPGDDLQMTLTSARAEIKRLIRHATKLVTLARTRNVRH